MKLHASRTVLHIYEETREDAGEISTADGQEIPIDFATVKVRCVCGCVYLDTLIFAAQPKE